MRLLSMKSISLKVVILLLVFAQNCWALTKDDLVMREGRYYEKFSTQLFSGAVYQDEEQNIKLGIIRQGLKEGEWLSFYPNGQLMTVGNMVRGKVNGISKAYWEDGKLMFILTYVDDVLHGSAEEYYKNGQLMEKGHYVNGQLDGFWEF